MNIFKDRSVDAHPDRAVQYTASLGLLERLKRPEIKVDFIPVLDLMVLGLLISLLFTRFVMLPGVRVDLPSTDLRMQYSASAVAVLTIGNKGMLFFDGSVYEIGTVERAFRRYIESVVEQDVVLLVKAEANMELQLFLDLCRMAQEAGFVQVQIAGEKVAQVHELIPTDTLKGSGNALFPVM
jgi:biopolymer transport protein ExbD